MSDRTIPDEAVEHGSIAIYEMTKGARIPGELEGRKMEHVGTDALARAVLEAAAPFLTAAPSEPDEVWTIWPCDHGDTLVEWGKVPPGYRCATCGVTSIRVCRVAEARPSAADTPPPNPERSSPEPESVGLHLTDEEAHRLLCCVWPRTDKEGRALEAKLRAYLTSREGEADG